MKLKILLIMLIWLSISNAQDMKFPIKKFDKSLLVNKNQQKGMAKNYCYVIDENILKTIENDSIKQQKTSLEKIVTVTFYTIAGIASSLLYLELKYGNEVDNPDLYAGLKYLMIGAGAGMTVGILVIKFDLDKPFRKKYRKKKKE